MEDGICEVCGHSMSTAVFLDCRIHCWQWSLSCGLLWCTVLGHEQHSGRCFNLQYFTGIFDRNAFSGGMQLVHAVLRVQSFLAALACMLCRKNFSFLDSGISDSQSSCWI